MCLTHSVTLTALFVPGKHKALLKKPFDKSITIFSVWMYLFLFFDSPNLQNQNNAIVVLHSDYPPFQAIVNPDQV